VLEQQQQDARDCLADDLAVARDVGPFLRDQQQALRRRVRLGGAVAVGGHWVRG